MLCLAKSVDYWVILIAVKWATHRIQPTVVCSSDALSNLTVVALAVGWTSCWLIEHFQWNKYCIYCQKVTRMIQMCLFRICCFMLANNNKFTNLLGYFALLSSCEHTRTQQACFSPEFRSHFIEPQPMCAAAYSSFALQNCNAFVVVVVMFHKIIYEYAIFDDVLHKQFSFILHHLL